MTRRTEHLPVLHGPFPGTMQLALWLAPRPRLAAAWLAVSFAYSSCSFQPWIRWTFVA